MTQNKAIQESVDHWKEMIKWVEIQDPSSVVSPSDMEDELDVYWTGNDCALCRYENNTQAACLKCPLAKKYGRCANEGTRNVWDKVYHASTWGEWLINARLMYYQLKSLLPVKNQKYDDLVTACHTTIIIIQDILNNLKKEL